MRRRPRIAAALRIRVPAPTRFLAHSAKPGDSVANARNGRIGAGLTITPGRPFWIARRTARATASRVDGPRMRGADKPNYLDRAYIPAVTKPSEDEVVAPDVVWEGRPEPVLGAASQGSRHAHASLLLQQGVHPKVVSERSGHSTVGVTQDIYSHVVPGL